MPVSTNTIRKAYAYESDRPYVIPILEYFADNPEKQITLADIREDVNPDIDSYEWVQFARMFIKRKDGCGLGYLDKHQNPKDPHGRKSYSVAPKMIPDMRKFIAYCKEGKE